MRVVNRQLLDDWVHNNGPDGIARLAIKSGISSSMISKVRVGRVPTKPNTRRDIAQAVGISEDELFPLVNASSGEAS